MTLKRGLTRLEGVADAKLILKPPHMEVKMKPGSWPDIAKMQQTVRDAGYKPIEDGVELTVSGKVVKQGDGYALELDQMKAPVTLPVVTAKDDDTAAHLGEKHLGQTVQVEGRWQAAADPNQPGMLAVTAITSAKVAP